MRGVGRLGEEGSEAQHRDELFDEDNLQDSYVSGYDGGGL